MNWFKKIVILTAVIFSSLFFIYYFSDSFNFFLFSYKEIEVPDILGKELKEAEKILKQNKLHLVISDSRFSDKIPENFIIEQSPYSGKKVRENRDIFVVVSSGYNLVKVPDLKGYSLREA
ncbi:MAG: PASTA domain-containing protein, partial [Armatimonadetes bacterium]|nr:PASTA domain-containing protein [Armatimonadota bacterium]